MAQKFIDFGCIKQLGGGGGRPPSVANPDLEVRCRERVKKCLFYPPSPPRS